MRKPEFQSLEAGDVSGLFFRVVSLLIIRRCLFLLRTAVSVGPTACPFTTLYWDFLLRHESRLSKNPRMVMQVKNLTRLSPEQQAAIRDQAARLRSASQPDASSAAVPG